LIADDADSALMPRHEGTAIELSQFVAAAPALIARLLSSARYCVNPCRSRYCFPPGFAAALITSKTSLLSPDAQPVTLQLRRDYRDHCITGASAPYLPAAETLQDRIEPPAGGHFRLLGHKDDRVKVGGRRVPLEYLIRPLPAVPGVSKMQLLEHLRVRVDPVFVPRPLRIVAKLPCNALGKRPRAQLLALPGA
jgi:hypothetical protein